MIVVFGSLNIDLVFALAALPRRGETVLAPSYRTVPGGKGANQAAAAARAGARVLMAGRVGDDAFGRAAVDALAAVGVDTAGVEAGRAPTGCAAVLVDAAGENSIAVAGGANLEAAAGQVGDADLGPGTTVVVQMEVPVEETAALARRARARGARVILNLAPAREPPPGLLDSIDVLVVNRIEAEMAAAGFAPGALPEELARLLAAAHGITAVVTLGGEGALAVGPDGGGWRIGAAGVRAVDTTGAGDAFVGVLAAALDGGEDLAEALRLASAAAGLACTADGARAGLADRAEIARAAAALDPATPIPA